MYSVVSRQKYHVRRFSSDLVFSTSILIFVSMLIGLFYPGAENMEQFIPVINQSGLQGLFGDIDVNNPGWVMWLGMTLNMVLYYTLAITAINLGLKLIPLEEEDGLELLVGSTSSPSIKYFVENIVAGIITLFIIALPSLLILAGFSATQDSSEFIGRLVLVFLFQLVIAIIYMLLTAYAALRTFSRSSGKKWGFGYLIFSLMMELSVPALDEQRRELVKISMNYYLQPTSGLISGEFNFTGLGILMLVGLILSILALRVLPSHDYTESVGTQRTSRTLLPTLSAKNPIFQRFPLVVEQIMQDRGFFMVWTILIMFSFVYLIFTFQTQMTLDEFEQLLHSNNFGPLMGDHDIPATYIGFLAYELFVMHWLWFGLFIIIIAANIPTRDVSTSTQDSLYANDISVEHVVYGRTTGLLIMYSLFHWILAATVFISSWVFGADISDSNLFVTFVAGWIYYIGIALFYTSMAMLVKPSKGKRFAYWIFIISLSVSFGGSGLITYFTPLGYYDPVGILVNSVEPLMAILVASLFAIISASLYLIVLKFRYIQHDIN